MPRTTKGLRVEVFEGACDLERAQRSGINQDVKLVGKRER